MEKLISALKEGAKYTLKCKKLFLKAAISIVIAVALGLLAPVIEARIINTVVYNTGTQNLKNNIIIFFIVILIYTLSSHLSNYYLGILQPKTGFLSRKDKLSRLQKTSIKFLSKQDTNALADKVSMACNAPSIFFYDAVLIYPQHIFIVVFCFVMIARYNFVIALIILGMVAIDSFTYKKFQDIRYKLVNESYELSAQYGSYTRRQLSDAKYIRQHGLSGYFSDKLEKTFYALLTNITTQEKAELIYKMVNKTLNLILKVSIYGFIGLSVMKGDLTVGIFTLLIQYSEKLMTSFNVLYEESLYIQDRLVAIDKIEKYYSVYSYEDTDSVTDDISQINIEDLDFGFDDNKIFDNYSLEIKKGEIYNLKGDNGSGKSTLINIFLGLYMGDYTGKINYNGKSLDSLNITQINLYKIGLTEQEPNLLDESIRYNVALTEDATNDEKIMELARTVNLDEFILSLENKLSTKIEQSSANLSGGQKQKISIMKALYKNPDVLILDEPTSALDVNSKDKLKKYLQETKEDRITIIITHDRDFAGIADRLISF